MKFREMFLAVLTKLGMVDRAKDNKLSAADWAKINTSFAEEHKMSIEDALTKDKNEEQPEMTAAMTEALSIINAAENTDGGEGEEQVEGNATKPTVEPTDVAGTVKALNTIATNLMKENATLKQNVDKLAKTVIPENTTTVKPDLTAGFTHNEKYAFGVAHVAFEMGKRYNQIAVNPAVATLSAPSADDENSFKSDLKNFGATISARYAALVNANLLNVDKLNAGVNYNFTGLGNAGLGDQFVQFRSDLLIARIVELQQDVYAIFPRRFGVQDRELMTNAFLGDFSAAYQSGKVFKGSIKLEPEIGYVDDSMFKTQFDSLKSIERKYIGYLNSEGSDPIKWSMIEWMLLQIAKKLVDEQKRRVIMGCFVAPEAGKVSHFMNAGNGFVYTVLRYMHENKLNAHTSSAYASYNSTSTNMVDAVKAFVADAKLVNDLAGMVLYLNDNHKSWWKSSVRAKYGKDFDFSGPDANKVPDEDTTIVWLKGMGQLTLMVIAQPGNFQPLENVPGEMMKISFQQDMESVITWSVWKEGFTANFVGPKFGTKALLAANNFENQWVFANYPAVSLAADATTIDAAAISSFIVKSVANTAAKALTDITNAKAGVVYKFECGATANATTIAKAGKFANITAAYTPTAVGDYIMLVLNSDGDGFLELERCVAGVRTINVLTQPNTPGGRV